MLDVIIIGAGPAGMQAALTLARGQRKVALFDAGARRNARSVAVHNFHTRDGTPPQQMRDIGKKQLARYALDITESRVTQIKGPRGAFTIATEAGEWQAKRILLAMGMIDDLPALPGLDALWGETVFQCPYCHGHEVRDQRWAVLANQPMMLEMALMARNWTKDVLALTADCDAPEESLMRLANAGVQIDARPLAALHPAPDNPKRLGSLQLGKEKVPCDAMIMRPKQHQTPLVLQLGLELDERGYVKVSESGETSVAGIYAAGDLITPFQAAMAAASSGMLTAGMLNHELTISSI